MPTQTAKPAVTKWDYNQTISTTQDKNNFEISKWGRKSLV
jgi:hypothetical protein